MDVQIIRLFFLLTKFRATCFLSICLLAQSLNVRISSVNYYFILGLPMNNDNLQMLDLHFNWHPCSQMKDYELFKPLIIKKAYDCYFELSDGTKIIDAISSWWCKSLGHQHPQLKI